MTLQTDFDVIIIGAGAAGLMCAIEAGKNNKKVWLIDHSKKIAEKIRISGGGRCNFTNVFSAPDRFLSANEHFCKSVFSQYTQEDFVALVEKHNIPYHEKKLGQLFCDISAKDIISMLVTEVNDAGVNFQMETAIDKIDYDDEIYHISTSRGVKTTHKLVIATGGLSIPKIGATGFGYKIAQQFGLTVTDTRAALVPLTFSADLLEMCKSLSGLSVEASVTCGKTCFAEGLLFTHRGLSGPSILQISSYWAEGQDIIVDLCPTTDALEFLKNKKESHPKQDIQNIVSDILPKRLAHAICERNNIVGRIAELPNTAIEKIAHAINQWTLRPSGTEGYRTAEVTLGGVSTAELSSKNLESKKQKNLYFIGEVIDVTGHLGGFNFQWAWSSGFVVGRDM